MKKKLILGAIALMSVFGGMTIYESMSGQNEVKANVPPSVTIYCSGNGVCLTVGSITVIGEKRTVVYN